MSKKDEKELLEIPEFLKKLSEDNPQTQKAETVIEKEETKVNKKVKPKIDIQAKIKEHTQNYYIDIKDIINQHIEGEQAESVYEYCKENDIALTYCGKLLELVNAYKQEPSVGLEARNVKQDERTEEQHYKRNEWHDICV